ncbi:MAG: hypothetical protein BWY43_00766 [candidate division WS2 bacterium ADurb.Bin280]|uniref:Uncharacterized protein n=1 Tax=candidate division WS2 bacterium ADurb.Bin280 TaxID=1852829 RepID=A0A1V5SBM3_9BACT|nr:MAG: hypothetical protein BWY43_00766 [candidate division WS2 bacterium ADurb.Bin280]
MLPRLRVNIEFIKLWLTSRHVIYVVCIAIICKTRVQIRTGGKTGEIMKCPLRTIVPDKLCIIISSGKIKIIPIPFDYCRPIVAI